MGARHIALACSGVVFRLSWRLVFPTSFALAYWSRTVSGIGTEAVTPSTMVLGKSVDVDLIEILFTVPIYAAGQPIASPGLYLANDCTRLTTLP